MEHIPLFLYDGNTSIFLRLSSLSGVSVAIPIIISLFFAINQRVRALCTLFICSSDK